MEARVGVLRKKKQILAGVIVIPFIRADASSQFA